MNTLKIFNHKTGEVLEKKFQSYDEIDDVFTKTKGIVYGGIYYRGN